MRKLEKEKKKTEKEAKKAQRKSQDESSLAANAKKKHRRSFRKSSENISLPPDEKKKEHRMSRRMKSAKSKEKPKTSPQADRFHNKLVEASYDGDVDAVKTIVKNVRDLVANTSGGQIPIL